jgi:undecaprenyl-diphosphatase
LFGNAYVIAACLATVGVMIILSARQQPAEHLAHSAYASQCGLERYRDSACLSEGFSRSGSTISTGLFLGLDKVRVEEFSFALAVVLTPA